MDVSDQGYLITEEKYPGMKRLRSWARQKAVLNTAEQRKLSVSVENHTTTTS
jgi:hypothetical protein